MVLMPLLSRLLTLLVILTMPLFLARLTLIPIKSLSIRFRVSGLYTTTVFERGGCVTAPRLTLMSLIKLMLVMVSVAAILFLSSRSRHPMLQGDWSSDVCSSDLRREIAARLGYQDRPGSQGVERFTNHYYLHAKPVGDLTPIFIAALEDSHRRKPKLAALWQRSEERRVGKEGRSRWWPYH